MEEKSTARVLCKRQEPVVWTTVVWEEWRCRAISRDASRRSCSKENGVEFSAAAGKERQRSKTQE